LLAGLLFLAGWEAAGRIFQFNEVVLPSPIAIGQAFFREHERLFEETFVTMMESILGFAVGGAGAFVLAVLFIHWKIVEQAFFPFAVALKSTPLIAIAPLLVLWFGNGLLSKIVMSAIVAFFPVLVNSVRGLGSIDPEALDLMRSLSASRWQVLVKMRIPASAGYVFSSLKIASAMAVVGAVIGEFTGASVGIGNVIKMSSYYLDTPLMFAAIAMISLGGIVFFALVALLERVVVFWQPPM
jgi:NitT/TauT family transport system permease protein